MQDRQVPNSEQPFIEPIRLLSSPEARALLSEDSQPHSTKPYNAQSLSLSNNLSGQPESTLPKSKPYIYESNYYWKVIWESRERFENDKENYALWQSRIREQCHIVEWPRLIVYFHLRWTTTIGKMRKLFKSSSHVEPSSKLTYREVSAERQKEVIFLDYVPAKVEMTHFNLKTEEEQREVSTDNSLKRKRSFDNEDSRDYIEAPIMPKIEVFQGNNSPKKSLIDEDLRPNDPEEEFIIKLIKGTPIKKLVSNQKEELGEKIKVVGVYIRKLQSIEGLLQQSCNRV